MSKCGASPDKAVKNDEKVEEASAGHPVIRPPAAPLMSSALSAPLMSALGPVKNDEKVEEASAGHQDSRPPAAPLMMSSAPSAPMMSALGAGPSARPITLSARGDNIKRSHALSKNADNRPPGLLPVQGQRKAVKRKLDLDACEYGVEREESVLTDQIDQVDIAQAVAAAKRVRREFLGLQ